MKNAFLILSVVFFLGINSISAQEHQFGIIAGIGGSNDYQKKIHPAHPIEKDSKPIFAYHFNLSYTLKFNRIGIAIEPGYIRKGSKILNANSSLEWDYDWFNKYNYLYAPLLVNWYLGKRIYFSLGPEFAYHLSTISIREGKEYTYKDIDDRFQLSGIIGLSFQIMKNLDVGLRYSHELPHNNDVYYFLQQNLHFVAKYKVAFSKKK